MPPRDRVDPSDQHVLEVLAAGVPTPLGDLCRQAHQQLAGYLEDELAHAGWRDLRAAHVSVLATIDPAGSRLTTLAERGGRTKQTTAQLIAHLVEHRYLRVRPDGADARAKLYTPTQRALRLLAESEKIVDGYRQWLAAALGPRAMASLRRSLLTIINEAPPSR